MPISCMIAGRPTGLELLSEPFPDVKNDMLIEGLEKLLPDCQSGDKFDFAKDWPRSERKKQAAIRRRFLIS